MLVRAVVVLLLCVATTASAQSETCAETFPQRLADAKRAVVEYDAQLEAYEKARPALEWFEAHCRFLTPREVAARKLDDANAFVCDPRAKARPSNLTSELVLQFSTVPTIGTYQEHHGENHRCVEADRSAGIVLVFAGELTALQRLELLCWADPRQKCVDARKTIAAARANGHR